MRTSKKTRAVKLKVSDSKKSRMDLEKASAEWSLLVRANFAGTRGLSFDGGLCGMGLFAYYRYQDHGLETDLELFFDIVDKIVERINTGSVVYRLITIDFTELLLFLRITNKLIEERYDREALERVLMDTLTECSATQLANGQYDPYVGAFYPVYYFVISGNGSAAEKGLKFMEENLIRTGKGAAYFDSKFREGKVALGITHGLAFYINLLCTAIKNTTAPGKSLETLRLLTNYLKEERQDGEEYGSFFPDYSGEFKRTRLSLCYGDAGVLYALFNAAGLLNDDELKEEVVSLLYRMRDRRSKGETGVKDPGLLYGSAGLYLFYTNLNHISGMEVFREAAEEWKTESINSLLSPGVPFGSTNPLSFQNGPLGSITALGNLDATRAAELGSLFYL